MKNWLRRLRSRIAPQASAPAFDELKSRLPDLDEADRAIIGAALPFTMTSPERVAALITAVKYVVKANIAGAFVECGVWRGGSMVAVARMLQLLGQTDRDLYLYDTFEGMPPPSDRDLDFAGFRAAAQLATAPRDSDMWGVATLDEVKDNLWQTGYPESRVHFLKGKVEDTIPNTLPLEIALLRLDTDWYESTLHELLHLYPRLASRGVLIVDDYGHWLGARKAVDEFTAALPQPLLLHRIDYTGRIALKP